MYSIVFITLAMLTNGYLFWSIPFLTMFPEYICPPEKPECDFRDRCANPEKVRINWNSTRSLHNWVEFYNLECKSKHFSNDKHRCWAIPFRYARIFSFCRLDSSLSHYPKVRWYLRLKMASILQPAHSLFDAHFNLPFNKPYPYHHPVFLFWSVLCRALFNCICIPFWAYATKVPKFRRLTYSMSWFRHLHIDFNVFSVCEQGLEAFPDYGYSCDSCHFNCTLGYSRITKILI